MKNLSHLKILVSLLVCAVLIVSCEKSDLNTETNQSIETEEGFKSTTGNNDQVIENNDSKINQPILQLHFDKNVSKEEAMLKRNEVVEEYMSKQPTQQKGYSTELFYEVWIITGTQTDNNTDGFVSLATDFNSDQVDLLIRESVQLDIPNYDDREGGWDYYFFRYKGYRPERVRVSWVEIDSARLALQGTDGWFVKELTIAIFPSVQTAPASGGCYFSVSPNIWMDNEKPNGWDLYYTGSIENTGRILF